MIRAGGEGHFRHEAVQLVCAHTTRVLGREIDSIESRGTDGLRLLKESDELRGKLRAQIERGWLDNPLYRKPCPSSRVRPIGG